MSSLSTSNNTAVSTRQDSQQKFTKKPPPLDIRKSSQEAMSSVPPSASSGQRTPPILSVGASGPLDVKEKKIGHRRVDEQTGQVTYKKKTTSDLMQAIQLGIGQSVGSLTSKPNRDVLMQDFSVVESVHFPENGSNLTPAHRAGEFRFKTYAPIAFRYFRELFGIQTDDFLISLTGLPLTELSNPGASGSVFFITEDDEFIIKTVQHKEADFLQKLLPGYYMNLNQNPRTLLPKFYGLYCLQSGGKNIRLCVMNNLLPSAIRKSEKYDLKGSTYKRKASKHELAKSSPTFKDLDFRDRNPDGISLEADTYDALMKTVKRDCRVLESFKIMDYSLLLCMYNVDEAKRRKHIAAHGNMSAAAKLAGSPADQPSTSNASGGAEGNLATPGMITRGRSTKHRLQQFSTAMESIQADAADPVELDDEDVPPGGIPARSAQGERLLLYIGIIDILQSYRLKKKLEHGFKSIVYDGDSISVHRPSFYAQRFQTFFEKEVFRKIVSPIRSPSKKKSTTRQRSLTEQPAGGAAGANNEAAGSLLHKNKPDLIPQVSEDDSQPSSSTNAYDPRWSATTMSTVHTYSSSNASTVIRGPYTTTQSKELATALHTVKEHHSELPPQHEDPLPPYSEQAPAVEASDNNGGARSKLISLQAPSGNEPNKTVSAPSVLGHKVESLTKSAIKREKSDGSDSKKGVRFSSSHSDDETTEDDKLLPSPDATKPSQQSAGQAEVQPLQQTYL